ncbi:site-specific integrase [Hymenobacter sp. BT442]|uniref:Site-specific integrase n=2 Tax=Hymenobacter negativus TaxID=2795026 RepID=A0ABS0QAZ2_9BACT|nr:site-specific integrase [Hymenobacter negativus]
MQVVLDSEVVPVALGITWPALLVDEDTGTCLTKLPKAQQGPSYAEAVAAAKKVFGADWEKQAADHNLIIGQALGRANKVFRDARMGEVALDKARFLTEYKTGGSKVDFLVFMSARINERFDRGEINKSTWKNHRSTYNKLADFRKKIPFNTLTHRFADEFEGWLKRNGHGDVNTRWGRHRDVKTYLAYAKRDKIPFEDPYAHFRPKQGESSWKALQPDEFDKLEAYYKLCAPCHPHRRVLQKFLFSCTSSLRLGDLKAIGQAKLNDRQLHIKTHKGREQYGKELLLPLTRKALRYLREAQQENGTEGFFDYSDQYTNRQLQEMAAVLGIQTHLHNHVGRETFATNFIRYGGNVAVLQKLMGHSKLSTTMKYVHVDEAMKQAEIDRMDALDN